MRDHRRRIVFLVGHITYPSSGPTPPVPSKAIFPRVQTATLQSPGKRLSAIRADDFVELAFEVLDNLSFLTPNALYR